MPQLMTFAEMVEVGHRARGEPTYAELQAQRDSLLRFVEIVASDPHEPDCRLQYGNSQCRCICVEAAALVATVKGK